MVCRTSLIRSVNDSSIVSIVKDADGTAVWSDGPRNKNPTKNPTIRKQTELFGLENKLTVQWRIQDFPLRGGGTDLRHGCFSAKTYAKTKELDPVGGGGRAPAAPPGSANAI